MHNCDNWWCQGLTSAPGAQGIGLTSCGVAPRPSRGQHARGPEPPVFVGSPDLRSDLAPAAADQTARRPGRYQRGRRSPCGVPGKVGKKEKLSLPGGVLYSTSCRAICILKGFQYLMSLQKSLSSSDIFGQLLRGHQPTDAINPGHQISVHKRKV